MKSPRNATMPPIKPVASNPTATNGSSRRRGLGGGAAGITGRGMAAADLVGAVGTSGAAEAVGGAMGEKFPGALTFATVREMGNSFASCRHGGVVTAQLMQTT